MHRQRQGKMRPSRVANHRARTSHGIASWFYRSRLLCEQGICIKIRHLELSLEAIHALDMGAKAVDMTGPVNM